MIVSDPLYDSFPGRQATTLGLASREWGTPIGRAAENREAMSRYVASAVELRRRERSLEFLSVIARMWSLWSWGSHHC